MPYTNISSKTAWGTVLLLALSQVIFIVLFAVFVEYSDEAHSSTGTFILPHKNNLQNFYSMFQDVHVMIFIGFGFLMTFLRKYGYSAVGYNMLIAAMVLQWATLVNGFFHLHHGKIQVSIETLLGSDFTAAAVLISFGAVLGVTSPIQLVVMAIIEVPVFAINEVIGRRYFKAIDMGDSMFVHAFGAYFGLGVSAALYRKNTQTSKEGSDYRSDLFSLVGTVFLWVFWPSFNSALAPGDDQHRAVINTYFSLAACVVAAFAFSSLVHRERKFAMEHIQNATLAGGVAIGTAADLMVHPYGALLIGSIAGIISVLGFHYFQPLLFRCCRIHDTCGVHNLHGMPGVMAGIVGAIMAAIATEKEYGYSLYEIFPARAPMYNSTELLEIKAELLSISAGDNRSATSQGAYQLLALVVSVALGLVGGLVTGLFLRLPIWNRPEVEDFYDDDPFWEIPLDAKQEEEEEEGTNGEIPRPTYRSRRSPIHDSRI